MIIIPAKVDVIHVHDDEFLYTVVESYRNYDGIDPVYTIIREDAHASPVVIQSNKKAQAVNEFFKQNIIKFLTNNKYEKINGTLKKGE